MKTESKLKKFKQWWKKKIMKKILFSILAQLSGVLSQVAYQKSKIKQATKIFAPDVRLDSCKIRGSNQKIEPESLGLYPVFKVRSV